MWHVTARSTQNRKRTWIGRQLFGLIRWGKKTWHKTETERKLYKKQNRRPFSMKSKKRIQCHSAYKNTKKSSTSVLILRRLIRVLMFLFMLGALRAPSTIVLKISWALRAHQYWVFLNFGGASRPPVLNVLKFRGRFAPTSIRVLKFLGASRQIIMTEKSSSFAETCVPFMRPAVSLFSAFLLMRRSGSKFILAEVSETADRALSVKASSVTESAGACQRWT